MLAMPKAVSSLFFALTVLLIPVLNAAQAQPKEVRLPLTQIKPVTGEYRIEHDVSINGKIFDDAVTQNWNKSVVLPNREGYEFFEATIGKQAGTFAYDENFPVTFVVLGDGQELYRSPKMVQKTSPLKIRVPIKQYRGITLSVETRGHNQDEFGGSEPCAWCDPVFIKFELPPAEPEPMLPPGEHDDTFLWTQQPVQGEWLAKNENVVINGRIFDRGVLLGRFADEKSDRAVFSNKDGFDYFEAWIGMRGGRYNRAGRIQFIVLGDGKEIYRSAMMGVDTPAIKVLQPIKQYRGVTLLVEGDIHANPDGHQAVWAEPKLIRYRTRRTMPSPVSPPTQVVPDPGTDYVLQDRLQVVVAPAGIVVLLNGQLVKFQGAQPARIGGRVMVPLRGIFEALGASVQYDPVNMTISSTRAYRQMRMQIGSRRAVVGGKEVLLDVPPMSSGGRILVPLRFVAEAFGVAVSVQ